ncbi:unnamed protein product [Vitrella brassicaformis CCMP3155]|uniref:Uncharacterized protein n=1 Tax=Vitrella brassicaformis (strain CCMP3155) TaxID=1169540 RepID=A0A0G4FL86_VITBC|nr:unnamed protein product [Vitrella brassicaformis CCMP3155]|eukprot:CEM14756.1 unnamed protein product [Vitrella brassicaformis CCMP3155]
MEALDGNLRQVAWIGGELPDKCNQECRSSCLANAALRPSTTDDCLFRCSCLATPSRAIAVTSTGKAYIAEPHRLPQKSREKGFAFEELGERLMGGLVLDGPQGVVQVKARLTGWTWHPYVSSWALAEALLDPVCQPSPYQHCHKILFVTRDAGVSFEWVASDVIDHYWGVAHSPDPSAHAHEDRHEHLFLDMFPSVKRHSMEDMRRLYIVRCGACTQLSRPPAHSRKENKKPSGDAARLASAPVDRPVELPQDVYAFRKGAPSRHGHRGADTASSLRRGHGWFDEELDLFETINFDADERIVMKGAQRYHFASSFIFAVAKESNDAHRLALWVYSRDHRYYRRKPTFSKASFPPDVVLTDAQLLDMKLLWTSADRAYIYLPSTSRQLPWGHIFTCDFKGHRFKLSLAFVAEDRTTGRVQWGHMPGIPAALVANRVHT